MTETKLTAESQDIVDSIDELKSELEQIDEWLTEDVDGKVNEFIDKWQQVCQPEKNIPAEEFVEQAQSILDEIKPFKEQILKKAKDFAGKARNRLSVIDIDTVKESEVKDPYKSLVSWWDDTQQPRMEMYLNKCGEIEEGIYRMIELAMGPSNNSDKKE